MITHEVAAGDIGAHGRRSRVVPLEYSDCICTYCSHWPSEPNGWIIRKYLLAPEVFDFVYPDAPHLMSYTLLRIRRSLGFGCLSWSFVPSGSASSSSLL